MNSFLDRILTAQLENPDDVEVVNDAMGGSLAGGAESLNGKGCPWILWVFKHGYDPEFCGA